MGRCINEMLTNEGILRNGNTFKEVSTFEHNGIINLLFYMDGVDLDVGKLAMWRLQTHGNFGGTWLSDYVPNLMGIASQTLKQNGLAEQAKEMCEKITSYGSYDEALCIIGDYVNITSVDGPEPDGMEMHQSY